MLFAEKDFNLPEHPEIPGIPNLQVIKLMQSFKSRELVTERFAWRHYYWCSLPLHGYSLQRPYPYHRTCGSTAHITTLEPMYEPSRWLFHHFYLQSCFMPSLSPVWGMAGVVIRQKSFLRSGRCAGS